MENSTREKIDFVVLWVDGGDVEWIKEKNKYDTSKEINPENEASRFRDWDNMKYWFRSVEKFAPWVNKIHFVTYGHLPNFLNTEHPKLNIVNHKDIIDSKYLPTFNSSAIEININKIAKLSDEFVYFNDDMFILKTVSKTDFFKQGLPNLEGLEEPTTSLGTGDAFFHSLLNNVDIINKYFNKKEQYKKHKIKYINFKYGIQNLRNITLSIWSNYVGFKNPHMPAPFLKKTWDEVWQKENSYLNKVTSHKFRSYHDVTQFLFNDWQIVKGEFNPHIVDGKYFDVSEKNINEVVKVIEQQKYKFVCLNDSDKISNFDKVKIMTNKALEKILPEKSSFEK